MARPSTSLAILSIALLAACSGGGTTPTQGTTTTSGAGTATQGPGATTGGGGGGGIADPCANLTVEEAAGAMATDPLTAASSPGDPASCTYTLEGFGAALSITLLKNGAEAQFQSFVAAGSAEPVAGVGDQALFERGSRRLVFLVGDTFVAVRSAYIAGADAAQEVTTTIGKIIAARMTTGSVPPDIAVTAPPVISAEMACDLLSAEEAAAAMGLGPMTVAGSEFTPQFCTYSVAATSEVVATTFFQARAGAETWATYESSMATEPVAGLGDRAMFEASTNILFVLKGDTIFNVNVLTAGISAADALAQDRALAEIMLANL